jgi:hypothetical protein
MQHKAESLAELRCVEIVVEGSAVVQGHRAGQCAVDAAFDQRCTEQRDTAGPLQDRRIGRGRQQIRRIELKVHEAVGAGDGAGVNGDQIRLRERRGRTQPGADQQQDVHQGTTTL